MRIAYETWNPTGETLSIIEQADAICRTYAAQGYDLTLRQLYYQFVARALIPNNDRSYNRLGRIVNKARLAGLLDWDYIVDRTRNLEHVPHWSSPSNVMRAAANGYARDKWATQPTRVEVWVEKEALAGVISQVADRHDVAWFSCRGYVSQSELWAAARRHYAYIEGGQNVVVVHLGDHDPSGIDMTRDITDRLQQFIAQDWLNAHLDDFEGDRVKVSDLWRAMAEHVNNHEARHPVGRVSDPIEVRRIALNYDQVLEYDPPPNPAKMTDSRSGTYVEEHGDQSWELDALDPATLDALIEEEIDALRNADLWEAALDEESEERDGLVTAASRWAEVQDFLAGDES